MGSKLTKIASKKHRRSTKTPYGTPIKPAPVTAAGLSPVPEVSETSNSASIIEPRDPGKSYEAGETPTGAKALSPHESLTSKGTDETASVNSDVLAWSAILDSLLVGMRAQGRSWQEIHEVVPHKSIDDIKERAKYLHIDVKSEGKEKSGEASDSEESIKGKGKGKQAKGKGKEPEKKVKFTKPEEESEPEESSDEEYESDSDASATDPGDFPVGWPSPVDQGPKKKGVLRIVEADPGEEEPTEIRGRPIVYMQPEDQLTPGQVGLNPFNGANPS